MNPSNLKILNPITYSGWDDLLMSAPNHSFFHTSSWARVLKESYGYEPKYFTIIDRDRMKTLVPVMEVDSFLTGKRGVSLPFTDYCEPICNGNTEFVHLFNKVIEFGGNHGWKYLELRSGGNLNLEITRNSQPLPAKASAQESETRSIIPSCSYIGHLLNLSPNEGKLSSGLRDSTRRNIKKALKEGVKVKIDHSLESVKEFYRLNCLTRKEHGLPPQPFGFFEKIYDHIISKDLGMVVLASLGQENIAGAGYFHFNKKAVYKYGASDKKYQHLRANNLVMWEAIKWYGQNGYKSLCFGISELENQGLIQFKSGWGAAEHPIHYYRYDLKKNSFVAEGSKVTGIHNKVFNKMPAPMLNRIGVLFYRHFA
jgi:hypothetical protein